MLHHRAKTGPISVASGSVGAFLSHSAHFAQCELITPASAERAIRPNLGTQGTHTNRQGSARPIPPVSGPDRRVPTGLFRSSLKKGPTLVHPVQRTPAMGQHAHTTRRRLIVLFLNNAQFGVLSPCVFHRSSCFHFSCVSDFPRVSDRESRRVSTASRISREIC